jgi:hypothetical protein
MPKLREDVVPVGPFQRHFLRLEKEGALSRGLVARELGWFRRPSPSTRSSRSVEEVADVGRVTRLLGLSAAKPRKSINYETGVRLCRILGVDPVDVGV